MSVLHLTHTDILSDSRILKEITALLTNGYMVSGVNIGRVRGARSECPDGLNLIELTIRSRALILFPKFLRHVFMLIESTVKVVRIAVKLSPTVIHCHDTIALYLGLLIKIFIPIKIIYDAHELESDKNGQGHIERLVTFYFEKFAWMRISALIVVSPSIKNWYFKNFSPIRAEVIYNSPVLSHTNDFENNYIRRNFNIPNDSKVFIYIGGFIPGRGISLILEAFMMPNVSSHVVFLGYGELEAELLSAASLNSRIHVHNSIPHDEVVNIARSADFGLCLIENISLSDYYSLPNKLFEYVFAGLPVLGSNFPDIREVITDYGLGSCCELTVVDINQAIIELEHCSKDFKRLDLTPLSWESQQIKLLRLYRNMMHEC